MDMLALLSNFQQIFETPKFRIQQIQNAKTNQRQMIPNGNEYKLELYLLGQHRAKGPEIFNHFYTESVDVTVGEYNNTLTGITNMIRATQATQGKVLLSSASEAIQSVVPVERRLLADSPITKIKIIKNEAEAKGMKNAHIRDGAALIQYLHWLETEIDDRNITEIKGAEKLKYFRSLQENYRSPSFHTISAVGSNAALIHYRSTPETDKQITRKEIYLVDSGAQYLDGTTDITRTVHFGDPTEEQIDAFTRVLKGFISLSMAIFPPGAPFSFFDAMARRSLWDVGMDYEHSTGHGIGCYLNVHEIPPLISNKNSWPGMIENMFTSNEPGYYKEGSFGIRIEDVIQVVAAPNSSHYFNGKGANKFEEISMVPIQKKLINIDLLSDAEIKWLNDYHQCIKENVTPLLGNDSNIIEWLIKQTEPIVREHQCEGNTPPTEESPAETTENSP